MPASIPGSTQIWRFLLTSPSTDSEEEEEPEPSDQPAQEALVLFLAKNALNLAGLLEDKAMSKLSVVCNYKLLHGCCGRLQ